MHLLSHDLSFQFHTEMGYRAPEPEVKYRIIATCLHWFWDFNPFFSKFTPWPQQHPVTMTLTICMKIYLLFVSNLMPHHTITSLLVLRLWETVSTAFPFPFSMPLLVLQTWLPSHPSHSFLKLENSSILSLSLCRRTTQPNAFISIIPSGIFANEKKTKPKPPE